MTTWLQYNNFLLWRSIFFPRQVEGCWMPQFANGGGAGGPKARKGLLSADGRAVKTDARVTCQIIWQPGYLTPNMWMDSLIPLLPPIHCDFADQVRLSWSRLLFLSKTILVLCARLISNASQKSTITRYLARGLLTLQYINGGHQITWFVRVNYGDKWHLGNCYSGWVW